MRTQVSAMKSSEIKSHIEDGYVRASVIFQIVGQPKEHIEKTMRAYLENVKSDEEIIVIKEKHEPTEDVGEGLFSAICEADMLVKNIDKLNWLCVNFAPASIEIIEPKSYTISDKTLTEWTNDLLAKLHEVGMAQKSIAGQNQALIRNFNAMTKNAINLALAEPKEINEISSKIGLSDEYTQKFLDAMIKEKKIKKTKNSYHLIK